MDANPFRQFVVELADAYEHIYDLVSLRSHPLLKYFFSEAKSKEREIAWELHHTLLNAINELDPGPQAPIFSREWRRHRLMVFRYVDGQSPQVVADQLAISRRHYYREHESAVEAVGEILWRKLKDNSTTQVEHGPAETDLIDRVGLIRLEAARFAKMENRTNFSEVLNGVLKLLTERATQNALTISNKVIASVPPVLAQRHLLRQLLIGMIGHVVNIAHNGTIQIATLLQNGSLQLSVQAESGTSLLTELDAKERATLDSLEELANLCYASVQQTVVDNTTHGFEVKFRLHSEHNSVLVIDDNEDVLELFQRYLVPRNYEVFVLSRSSDALSIVRSNHPSAIILDLMMPGQDGWDLLQLLQNYPETQSIPIIVCSVLRQRELALSLGASAFLEKPVNEVQVLELLDTLMGSVPHVE